MAGTTLGLSFTKMRDEIRLTGVQLLRRPRNLIVFLLSYIFLSMLGLCLASMIQLKIGSSEFRLKAAELLFIVRELLNFKDAR